MVQRTSICATRSTLTTSKEERRRYKHCVVHRTLILVLPNQVTTCHGRDYHGFDVGKDARNNTTKENLPNLKKASLKLEAKMQKEAWPQGLTTITKLDKRLKQQITSKTPFVDQEDVLVKVGGRLELSDLTFGRKHPTLIPDTELGDALIAYLHSKTQHQIRKTTSAAIREAGYFPVGGRKRTERIVAARVSCRTLKAPKMT